MIDRRKYRIEPPVRPLYPCSPVSIEIKAIDEWKEKMLKYQEEHRTYNERLKEYHIAQEAMQKRYKIDLIKDLGLEGNEKAEKIWELAEKIAYDACNENWPYDDVFDCYIEELAGLVTT
jgi:hypothetical protein